MKKFLSILLALSLAIFGVFAVACEPKSTIVVAMPDGAPVLSVYELLKSVDKLDGHPVEYKIVSGAQEIATGIAKGEVDVAVMPTNVSAKFYNKGTDLKLLTVNVFGCLYLVGEDQFTNGIEDLKGKVVAIIGQGASPDITMKLILDSNNIEYVVSDEPVEGKVAIKYVSAGPDVISNLASKKVNYGVLGEPVASNAMKKLGVSIVMDLQQYWNGILGEDDCFTQAGVAVASSVYNDNGLIKALLDKLESNSEYILSDCENVQSVLTEKGSSLTGNFNSELLNRCNLKCQKAIDIKSKIEKYFQAVYEYDATFIGGKLPDEGFYYSAK